MALSQQFLWRCGRVCYRLLEICDSLARAPALRGYQASRLTLHLRQTTNPQMVRTRSPSISLERRSIAGQAQLGG